MSKDTQLVEESPLAKAASIAIEKSLQALVQFLRVYGYKSEPDISPTVKHWIKLAQEVEYNWMKVAKYKLAAFYSAHNNQVLPNNPFKVGDSPHHLIGGSAGRFLQQLLKRKNTRESILQGLKQSKKGMPRPNQQQLKEATAVFLTKMTTPLEGKKESYNTLVGWADWDKYPDGIELTLSRLNVEKQLRRTVQELFKGYEFTHKERIHAFFPSTSANYINNRQQSGSVGTILNHPTLLAGLRRPGGYLRTVMVEEEEHIQNEDETGTKVEVDQKGLDSAFEKLWFRLAKQAESEIPEVEPVALAEALKIRMITKMPPLQQTVLKNVWRVIHRRLRRHPCFSLLDRPVSESQLLDRMGFHLYKDEVYLSGDYEAATDNLKPWVSNTIADEISILLKLSNFEKKLFQQALTEHIFEGHKPQVTGQLMGSIVSFPVLCIANAALSRWSLELAEKRIYTLKDAKIMINGDDVAIRGHKSVYGFWQKITAFAGLKESLGKTYVSDKFVDINSTSFERTEEPFQIDYQKADGTIIRRQTHLRLTKYVNLGLLFGLKRSEGKVGLNDQANAHNNVSARARELLRLAPLELHESLMKNFINHHRDMLNKTRLPWYIPEWLGGIGLPVGSWGQPSELDLRIAHRILLNWNKERPIQLSHQETTWKTWLMAQKSLPKPVFARRKGLWTEEYESAVNAKCIDLLFDSNVHITDLFAGIQEGSKTSRAIAQNGRLWKPSHKAGKGGLLPKPLSLCDLEFQARYPNWRFDEPILQHSIASEGLNDLD